MSEGRTACQLCVVIEAGEAAVERLSVALGAAQVASVLIVAADGTLEVGAAKPLVQLAQSAGAAALIGDRARLVRPLGADGVHLHTSKGVLQAYEDARGILGSGGIVGVDPGISRHDAMTVAEAGVDYVAFGAPADLRDRDKARLRRNDLVAWWAEIFEVPCVALDVATAAEAEELAQIGADFVAITLPAGQSPADLRATVAEIAAAIRISETAG
jgi:thiamine-phosphate pyrophosphorylase